MLVTQLDAPPDDLESVRQSVSPCILGPRPQARGKFLFTGTDKLYLRGVTYGTFAPGPAGEPYPDPTVVAADFAKMADTGINAVRTYSVPPTWLLDLAQRYGFRVMVGIPWEQHVTFLADPDRVRSIHERIRSGVRACSGHPAVLCYAVGNEIPASIVRWHGPHAVERLIRRLYEIAKEQDPDGLVTYVNYPSTEYLRLAFLDLVCFNVFLEARPQLQAYLARLHNIAGDRPLVLAELGLDSRRHGQAKQARALAWQLETTYASGCAGAFVFSWTDEWHRGGHDISDWDFGLTTRQRRPKAALAAVRRAFDAVPFPADRAWPRVSVVVCCYNGSRTIRECLDGLLRLEYPDFEVIMVDDGSTDATPIIMREYPFRHITQQNLGLSEARNTGLAAATGAIVAYIDDDAVPDPHWLQYLAATYMEADYAAVGGPNIPPPAETPIGDCVANAPGGPIHVLLSDQIAEHVPGCNLSARTDRLKAIGGFDPAFRVAGDDVDVCWQLQKGGSTLGFSHGAMVWHRRRGSVGAYWKQQQGYGKAEALLERKWPEKYTGAGHMSWSGRLYGRGLLQALPLGRGRVYHGVWGTGLFQSVYEPAHGTLLSLPLMPEWYLVIAGLAGLACLGAFWPPLLFAVPLLVGAVGVSLVQAARGAACASFSRLPRSRVGIFRLQAIVAFLHLLQPLARLTARLRYGLTPWRRRHRVDALLPRSHSATIWSERWRAPEDWLRSLEAALRSQRSPVRRGNVFDRWDLEVRPGLLGGARLLMAVEEHGEGRQLLRYRIRPVCSFSGLILLGMSVGLAVGAAIGHAWIVAAVLGLTTGLLAISAVRASAAGRLMLLKGIEQVPAGLEPDVGERVLMEQRPLVRQRQEQSQEVTG